MSELLPKTISLPKDLYMPAEWEPHRHCIILYPHNRQTFRLEKAQAEIDHVIQTIAKEGHERVLIGCLDQAQADMVKNKAFVDGDHISVVVCPSNDTWARDTAPTFCRHVKTHDLVGLNWDFNAYGGPETGAYWPCDLDQQIATKICQHLNVKCVNIPIILEGGSFHTDGEGTLMVTKETLLNPNRNPHLSQDLIENILKTTLGVSVVIWLPKGLHADEDTNGHIDNFACFVKPGHVVLAWTDDEENDGTNYRRCRVASLQLKSCMDAKGRTIKVHKLHLPPPLVSEKDMLFQQSKYYVVD
jgi:agmatine deiminase